MYTTAHINELIADSEAAVIKPVERYGVRVYVDGDPDIVGPDIYISPYDTVGIEMIREFAAKMAAHYKTLTTTP